MIGQLGHGFLVLPGARLRESDDAALQAVEEVGEHQLGLTVWRRRSG